MRRCWITREKEPRSHECLSRRSGHGTKKIADEVPDSLTKEGFRKRLDYKKRVGNAEHLRARRQVKRNATSLEHLAVKDFVLFLAR